MINAIIPIIGEIIGKIIPDKEKAAEAKLKLLELAQAGELKELEGRTNIIIAEANGESWLQRNWRPITMISFVALLFMYWFGLTPSNIPTQAVMEVFAIVKIGLGGYVVGRSAEKVARVWKEK